MKHFAVLFGWNRPVSGSRFTAKIHRQAEIYVIKSPSSLSGYQRYHKGAHLKFLIPISATLLTIVSSLFSSAVEIRFLLVAL